MAATTSVRASRDGDQFHYVWGARRCLLLLAPGAELRAITIEGASPAESPAPITEGEVTIDVAEYYGSEDLQAATQVRYVQLRHSTIRSQRPMGLSELARTLSGFAERYRALAERIQPDRLRGKFLFSLVSNRPVSLELLDTVHDVASGTPARNGRILTALQRHTRCTGEALSAFCTLLRLEGGQDGLWDQRNALASEVCRYLPGADVEAPAQLKELVTRKALSENTHNPRITRLDVLRALGTGERGLFPAPCEVVPLQAAVARDEEATLISTIVEAESPIVVHAAGGVGKTVFATRIAALLPPGSTSVLYDCFGNGQYRSATGARHRHKDALVQIANELAAKGLCHLLIPSPHADAPDYMRAFLSRLALSVASLRSREPAAVVCIIADAADNAQLAADAFDERAFIRDLLREDLPVGVRLVALCRTHRQALLKPPPNVLSLELQPFSRDETATHLRQGFPKVTEQDVDEFHRLTSQNPRVQARALERDGSLDEILRSLGPQPTTVEDAIKKMLDNSIAKLRDEAGNIEQEQIAAICTGLATLRPLIPLSVLAALSGVEEAAIRSFAADLGRPLLITDTGITFLDEPTETWFRERFQPSTEGRVALISRLRPLAEGSTYAASALPQLMFEAGYLDELIALALSSAALPAASLVEQRDVELQRLQFAVKASMRARRWVDAAKLALKAGGVGAGDERQRWLLQEHTDLAAVFLQGERLQDLVARRVFGSDFVSSHHEFASAEHAWVGSHHAYEAGLLSGRAELHGEARSQLRMASDWLRHWSRLPDQEREKEKMDDSDILEMAMAHLTIHDAQRCAVFLRKWQPRTVSFRIGRRLAQRCIDHGRYEALDDLAVAAKNDLWLVLALTIELRTVNRTLQRPVVSRALRLALSSRIALELDRRSHNEGDTVLAVTALVEAAHSHAVGTPDKWLALLTRYLPSSPPRGLSLRFGSRRFSLLRAFALRAALSGQDLMLRDLAHDELRQELEHPSPHTQSSATRDFEADIGALLPWHILWATTVVQGATRAALTGAIAAVQEETERTARISFRDTSHTTDEIAHVWVDTLLVAGCADDTSFGPFNEWVASLRRPLFIPTITHLAHVTGRTPGLERYALEYAATAYNIVHDARDDASTTATSYVALARAVLMVSPDDARAYFNEAVAVASRIGEENIDRWSALLSLAGRAAECSTPAPETAYRLAHSAELTYRYVASDKHFAWEPTVEALAGLCGSSALAILSRWRDRGFGSRERLLPTVASVLLARGELRPCVALALLGFRAEWNEPELLSQTLAVCESAAEKTAATAHAYRCMIFRRRGTRRWQDIQRVTSIRGVTPAGLDEQLISCEAEERRIQRRRNGVGASDGAERTSCGEKDWDRIFEEIDLTVAEQLARAYQRLTDAGPPFSFDRFFAEACRRVPVGNEAAFIAVVADVPNLDLFDIRCLLEQIPTPWTRRPAITAALADTIKAFCRRYCLKITKGCHWDVFPWEGARTLSAVSEDELLDTVLTAIGESTANLDAERLFTLVALLAPRLSHDAAHDALSFGLALLEPLMEEEDGDGSWRPALVPPAAIDAAVAGYLWGCLAAPQASLRWEATHVVRTLCTFAPEVLAHLIVLARSGGAGPFADSGLPFYMLHARQWLLIGLARAASEAPEAVAPHATFLHAMAFEGEPHVLIREFAKRALLALVGGGFLAPDAGLRERLTAVNTSPFPVDEASAYPVHDDECDGAASVERERRLLSLGMDIGPYWLAPLGTPFGKTEAQMERAALAIICDDWQLPGATEHNADARYTRAILDHLATDRSQGSYPRADDRRFYLCYHAMMVVAGKLLATTPERHDPDDPDGAFCAWLARHSLARGDGGWLANRRDPTPLDRPAWKEQ